MPVCEGVLAVILRGAVRWPLHAVIACGECSVPRPAECGRQLGTTSEFLSDFFSVKNLVLTLCLSFLKFLLYYENIGSSHENCRRHNRSLQKRAPGALYHCNRLLQPGIKSVDTKILI